VESDIAQPFPIDVRVVGPVSLRRTRSIRRYAEELASALGELDEVRVKRVMEPPASAQVRGPEFLKKWGRRFRSRRRRAGPLPRQLDGLDGDVHQLVVQTDAYLLPGLPAERTVLTCHDLFDLRVKDEDLGFGRMSGGVGEGTLHWAQHLAGARRCCGTATLIRRRRVWSTTDWEGLSGRFPPVRSDRFGTDYRRRTTI